jgi:hypothetical protein
VNAPSLIASAGDTGMPGVLDGLQPLLLAGLPSLAAPQNLFNLADPESTYALAPAP